MLNRLIQIATLWTATPNGFGGHIFSLPIHIKCRWEERTELVPNSTEMAKSVVYIDHDASPEDYILLGSSDVVNPLSVGASRVLTFRKVPDLRNLETLRKVWL